MFFKRRDMFALLMVVGIEWAFFLARQKESKSQPKTQCNPVPNKEESKLMDFPYYYQLSNQYNPSGSCLLTCVAMVLTFFNKKTSPDSLYLEFEKRKWNRYLHEDIKKIFHEYEIYDNWNVYHEWYKVIEHLKKGYPVIFSGPKSFTNSGHVIVLLAFDEEKQEFLCHDPYGKWEQNNKYTNKPEAGKFVRYSAERIYKESNGGRYKTWAHLLQPYPPLRRVVGDENCSQAFKNKTRSIASKIGCDPSDLMAVMSFESGGSFSPSQRNMAGSGATGLIQFMPDTAKRLKTTTDALAKMTALQQLDYVEKYFVSFGKPKFTFNDLYMAVLWPAAIGKAGTYKLFIGPGITYRQNAGLDSNRDGAVTVDEAVAKVKARFLS